MNSMAGFSKKPYPITWEKHGSGVDISQDEFVKRIGGKEKNKRYHVGTSHDFNKDPTLNINSPNVKKYICMVGKCSGVIDKKPKDEE
jgi:hypothetical protein